MGTALTDSERGCCCCSVHAVATSRDRATSFTACYKETLWVTKCNLVQGVRRGPGRHALPSCRLQIQRARSMRIGWHADLGSILGTFVGFVNAATKRLSLRPEVASSACITELASLRKCSGEGTWQAWIGWSSMTIQLNTDRRHCHSMHCKHHT